MRILVAVALLLMVSASCSRGNRESAGQIVLPNPGTPRENGGEIVLPNPELLRTCPSKHPQLLRDPRTGADLIYPAKFHIDFAEGGCSYGFMAWYDKSVSFEQMRQAINQRYGKWEKVELLQPGSISIWRIESEKFVIQLTEVAEKDKDQNPGEPGMKQVIYLPMTDRPVKFSENLSKLSGDLRTALKSLCDCR